MTWSGSISEMSTSTQLELYDFERQANRAESTAARIEAKIEELEHPHRDSEILDYLYWEKDERMSTAGIAEELGCGSTTVRGNLRKNGIEVRGRAKAAREANRVERASYGIDKDGYERWSAKDPDRSTATVRVHQLLACLDNDPHEVFSDGVHCHHSTAHPAANVSGLIEVMGHGEHMDLHARGIWRYNEDGFPVLTMPEGDGFSTISVNRHETA